MLERMQGGGELAFQLRFRSFDLLCTQSDAVVLLKKNSLVLNSTARTVIRRNFGISQHPLELQPNSGTHHCVAGKVHVRIVIDFPKPFRTVVVCANSDGANESAGIVMS